MSRQVGMRMNLLGAGLESRPQPELRRSWQSASRIQKAPPDDLCGVLAGVEAAVRERGLQCRMAFVTFSCERRTVGNQSVREIRREHGLVWSLVQK